MKSNLSKLDKDRLVSTQNQFVATASPGGPLVEVVSIKNDSLDSFTFDHQKTVFAYIKTIGNYIDNNVPNFIEIWPFLGAYTKGGSWNPRLDVDLEFIGIAHYTVLKSLCYIIQNKDSVVPNDPDQKYKNVIFHYALIIDCIKQICFHIIKFQRKLDPSKEFPIKRLNKESFIKNMEKWFCRYYDKKFDTFKASGGLLMNEIHTSDKFISLLNKNGEFDAYNSFKKDKIGPLRNSFIHNPSIDIFWKGNEILVVRPEYIKDNKTIQNINRLPRESLIDPKVLMQELFLEATKMINEVWSAYCTEIKKINSDKNFKNSSLTVI